MSPFALQGLNVATDALAAAKMFGPRWVVVGGTQLCEEPERITHEAILALPQVAQKTALVPEPSNHAGTTVLIVKST